MLDTLFLQILNMSFTASYVILFVLLARLIFQKAPKIFSYALWSVVLFRLVCPFSFESVFSVFSITGRDTNDIRPFPTEIRRVTPPETVIQYPNSTVVMTPLERPPFELIFTVIWLVGIAALLIYNVVSLLKLRRRLKDAVQESGNIYTSASLTSPFVMGLFRPKIYLPAQLTEEEKRYILLHEQTHIKRLDHVVKIVSFFVLCLHWFNPLVWVAFFLSGRDMELSCDEAVIKKLGSEVKKDYSSSLLSLATGRRIVGGTPLAFGEGDTKSRIKNVLNYKKPAFWVIVVSVIAIVAIGVGLIANPKNNSIFIPKSDEVVSIRIEQINESASLGAVEVVDKNQIEIILKALQNTNKTRKESVNDFPNRNDYFQININGSDLRKIYLYNDREQYFIEEPYVGIYKTSRETSLSIAKIYTSPSLTKENSDYFIMTDEIGAIGCEYSVNKDNQLDTLQMLSALEKLNGFKFDTDWASHGYIKFVFNDKTPKDIFLRYCANVDEIWQQEYPIDSVEYKMKVPTKAGIYNFFADITWENGETETAYFSITVAEKREESAGSSNAENLANFEAIKIGTEKDKIHEQFGVPNNTLSGMYGDIYIVQDKRIIIYYEFKDEYSSPVAEVKISDYIPKKLTHDQAVSSALFSVANKFPMGECVAEGHIILGYDDSDKNETKIYALTSMSKYGFENGNFVEVSGSAFPAVITLFSDNHVEIEKPLDGSDNAKSIKEMFPKEYYDRVFKHGDTERDNLKQQREKYASEYLAKIGREAKIGDYSDFDYTSLTDVGVSVEASNNLQVFYKAHNYYPSFIGTSERLENGVRVVYEMSYDKSQGEIRFTKYDYDTNKTIEQFTADAKTGNIV